MWDRDQEGECREPVASQVQSSPLPSPAHLGRGEEAKARRAIVQCSQRETRQKYARNSLHLGHCKWVMCTDSDDAFFAICLGFINTEIFRFKVNSSIILPSDNRHATVDSFKVSLKTSSLCWS